MRMSQFVKGFPWIYIENETGKFAGYFLSYQANSKLSTLTLITVCCSGNGFGYW